MAAPLSLKKEYITVALELEIKWSLVQGPRAGSGVVTIDLIHFLARRRTRRLNQALSVLSLNLDYLCVSVVLLSEPPLHCVTLCYLCVLSLGCSC